MSRRRNRKLLEELKDREYREEFLNASVRGGIAYQMQALRRQENCTQEEFAEKTGKKQSQIARLESTEYGGVSVQTLIDIAASLGIGLLVRFVDFAEMLERTEDMSDAALMATPIDKLRLDDPATTQPTERKVFVAHRVAHRYDKGADTWQTTKARLSQISYLKELLQTNFPSGVPADSGMSTQTMSALGPTSSTLH